MVTVIAIRVDGILWPNCDGEREVKIHAVKVQSVKVEPAKMQPVKVGTVKVHMGKVHAVPSKGPLQYSTELPTVPLTIFVHRGMGNHANGLPLPHSKINTRSNEHTNARRGTPPTHLGNPLPKLHYDNHQSTDDDKKKQIIAFNILMRFGVL